MADETFTDAIKEKLSNWLVQEGFSVDAAPPHDDFHWRLLAQDSSGRRFVLAQQVAHVDRVIIESTVEVSQEHRDLFSAMTDQRQEAILTELKIELLRMGVDYSNLVRPMTRLNVVDAIYIDGAFDNVLAKDTFFSRIEQVRRGLLMILVLLKRHIDEAKSN